MQTPQFLQTWSLRRSASLLVGGVTAISAFMASDWAFVGIGLIFVLMGVFALGCAGKPCEINPKADLDMPSKEDIEFKAQK